jgi:uncharacterized protein (TIGR02466 family)
MLTNIVNTVEWDYCRDNTTYYNNPTIPEYLGFDKFKNFIELNISILADSQGVDISRHKAVIDKIWINSMPEGATHGRHAHPGSHYSGTFYVNNPIGASRIRFYNPTQDLWGLAHPPIDTYTGTSASWIDYDPVPGNLLIWNSWLYHEVLENKSTTENRNTFSFNARMLEL